MKKTVRSLGYSIEGIFDAWRGERNIRNFVIFHAIFCILGFIIGIHLLFLIILTFAAAYFLTIELLNTALERLADAFDDQEKKKHGGHYHIGVKAAKDVGAAASLIALLLYIALLSICSLPSLLVWFPGLYV